MPDPTPSDETPTPPPPRRRTLTPEQRRFMGTQRIQDEAPEAELEPTEPKPEERDPLPLAVDKTETPQELPRRAQPRQIPAPEKVEPENDYEEREDEEEPVEERRRHATTGGIKVDQKASRLAEMQMPLLILGVLILFACTFFVGKKFDYWRYQYLKARGGDKALDAADDKFPGQSAEELVRQALLDEKAGRIQDATDRLLAAKRKDLSYRGLLFRVGKIAYDNGRFDEADKLFERAIAFGEDLAPANYFRGLIAVRHSDLSAAQRFFETAAATDPFTAQYQYYAAEALRLDHHPNESIPRYEHARLLALNEQDATVCQFKMRMARLEAGDLGSVAKALDEKSSAGELPVDWLMTSAAFKIRQGRVNEAVPLIMQARAADAAGLFLSCTDDIFFVHAAKEHPPIEEACRPPA